MAGRRLSRAAENPDGQPRPTQARAQVANLQDRFRDSYAGAQTEAERYRVAQRNLLSAATKLRDRDREAAREITREATEATLRATDKMLARLSELAQPRRSKGRPGGGQWTS
jgi:hypothetical protein